VSRCILARFRARLFAVLVFCAVVDASAQSFYGGVRGAVRDADGVVPGVQLTLSNEETAVRRTSVANGVGEYAFTDVVPGRYTLAAVLSGYKTFERHGPSKAPDIGDEWSP
jgi:hypothetical protein